MTISDLSKQFILFSSRECIGSSALYEHLAIRIANDNELIEIAAECRKGQPVPNLFFASIHYLLLKGTDHSLKDFYGSIVDQPRTYDKVFPYFKDFCASHKSQIIQLLQSKLVQTNEVRRCSYLFPAFSYIYNIAQSSMALIEIGTSAGLQLLWDKYSYTYDGLEGEYGSSGSNLSIASEIRGDRLPYMLLETPPITSRIGVDLHVNKLNDSGDQLWLKSLIWPEHKERMLFLDKAAVISQHESMTLIEGNGIELLSELASKISSEDVLCIFHTHVANQFSVEDKMKLIHVISGIGHKRDLFHLYNNIWDRALHLDYYLDGQEHSLVLAETDGHARWFEWKV
ncbi:DUF2332 domain-containing protein [Paenibacillus sp. GCM10023252]|uniref:DUF2332 domain-containing protein n=1 Tax=Paenibacillus sp. GCM10023252 TaxID=3252649 RepID=UPI00361A6CAF